MPIRVEGCEQNLSHTQSVETETSNNEEYNVSKSSRPLPGNAEGENVRRTYEKYNRKNYKIKSL